MHSVESLTTELMKKNDQETIFNCENNQNYLKFGKNVRAIGYPLPSLTTRVKNDNHAMLWHEHGVFFHHDMIMAISWHFCQGSHGR